MAPRLRACRCVPLLWSQACALLPFLPVGLYALLASCCFSPSVWFVHTRFAVVGALAWVSRPWSACVFSLLCRRVRFPLLARIRISRIAACTSCSGLVADLLPHALSSYHSSLLVVREVITFSPSFTLYCVDFLWLLRIRIGTNPYRMNDFNVAYAKRGTPKGVLLTSLPPRRRVEIYGDDELRFQRRALRATQQ